MTAIRQHREGIAPRPSPADYDYDDDVNEPSEPAPVHRTFFPETWLWRLERMRSVNQLLGHVTGWYKLNK